MIGAIVKISGRVGECQIGVWMSGRSGDGGDIDLQECLLEGGRGGGVLAD